MHPVCTKILLDCYGRKERLKVETRHTREGVSSQREIAAHVLMRQATGLKRKDGIIMKVFDEMDFNDILRTA